MVCRFRLFQNCFRVIENAGSIEHELSVDSPTHSIVCFGAEDYIFPVARLNSARMFIQGGGVVTSGIKTFRC